MANYPTSLDSFIQHADNIRETIAAAHANAIQDALVAVEETLGTNPQGQRGTVTDRIAAVEGRISALEANQGSALPVASGNTRGILKLAGDLSGSADAPRLTQLPNLSTIPYTDSFWRVVQLGSVSGTVTLDLTQGNYFVLTAVGNVTFAVTGWSSKTLFQRAQVRVYQDTTGSRTVTWPARFSTNSTLSGLSSAANSLTIYEFSSPDIGASVILEAKPSFTVPVQQDRYDAAVLNLANLLYYLPTEELSGSTAADATGNSATGTYSGTFTFNSVLTVPTSQKLSPTFASANSNYVSRDGSRRAASTSAWSLGFTIKASDPGLSSGEVIYSESLSTDSTTGQGFYVEAAASALSGGKTAVQFRLTNNSGTNIFSRLISVPLLDTIPHMVVISFDGGSTYTVYVDGNLSDTLNSTPTAATVDRATWGARHRSSTDKYFSGALGRFWLRSTATTAAEAAALNSAFSTGGTTSGGSGGGTQGGTTSYDKNGVLLHTPNVTANNSLISVSAVIDRNATVNFAYLQIAVRPPAGSGGTAFSTAYTPGTQTGSGTLTISGTGTCDVSGTWTAFATYSLVSNPVQADWVDGTPVSFPIGNVAPPSSDGGGTGTVKTSTVLLGAASASAAQGGEDSWIGKPIDVASTWCDSDSSTQINVQNIQPGQEFGSWNRYLDLAVGGIFSGDSWTQAGAGAYDSRWSQCLTNIKNYWGSRDPSKLFLRFAHEFNGDWFWPVRGSEAADFVSAWRRFRALQKQILPLANLVWCPNDGTTGSLGLTLMDAFPGSSYVDVYGVDFYNQYPHIDGTNQSAFDNFMNAGLGTRTPVGPEAHRQQAQALGLPIGFGEWGNTAIDSGGSGGGDAPSWINKVFDWFFLHQGSGPGQILYAVYFDIGQFAVNPPAGGATATSTAFKTRMLNRS